MLTSSREITKASTACRKKKKMTWLLYMSSQPPPEKSFDFLWLLISSLIIINMNFHLWFSHIFSITYFAILKFIWSGVVPTLHLITLTSCLVNASLSFQNNNTNDRQSDGGWVGGWVFGQKSVKVGIRANLHQILNPSKVCAASVIGIYPSVTKIFF